MTTETIDTRFDNFPTTVRAGSMKLLTVGELREFCKSHPNASCRPAYGTPKFRVGDLVSYLPYKNQKPSKVISVEWQDNTGFGHYSFWRVIIAGVSDQQCNFCLAE